MARDHLSVADVLGLYTVLMQRYGGAPGVRDAGALVGLTGGVAAIVGALASGWLVRRCSMTCPAPV